MTLAIAQREQTSMTEGLLESDGEPSVMPVLYSGCYLEPGRGLAPDASRFR